jgi:hypothetical protein
MITEREEPVLNPIESESALQKELTEQPEETSPNPENLTSEDTTSVVEEATLQQTEEALSTSSEVLVTEVSTNVDEPTESAFEQSEVVSSFVEANETTESMDDQVLVNPAISTTLIVESDSNNEAYPHLDEPEHDDDLEDDHHEDYTHYNKDQFVNLVKNISQDKSLKVKKVNQILKEIKPLFDELVAEEKEQAYQNYLASGGDKDSFEFREDKNVKLFYQIFGQIQKQRHRQIAEQEEQKEKNLAAKNEILEKLRALTEAEESHSSIEDLKKLQQAWKAIGPVSPQYNRALWASYNALVDRFYNNRTIFYELIELDRRKNLALKLAICEKAEKLVESNSIQRAIRELNELHEEFKHIGPVPKEAQESLWQRFKTASDKVYEKKRDFIKNREDEKKKNLELKLALVEEVKPFADYKTDKIAEWNDKTKELLDIQKKWDAIRFIPRESIKETSKNFWLYFKAFFTNKNNFIRTLDEERENNLKIKTQLCEEAEGLLQSEMDGRKIADRLKDLQRKWKDIGPVPSKFRDSIYERFKKACDSFFERRREDYNSQEREYEDNLKKKQMLCDKIDNTTLEAGIDAEDLLDSFVDEWRQIGFVPKKDKQFIQQKFEKALADFVNRLPNTNKEDKEKIQLNLEVEFYRDSPQAQRKVAQKESVLRRKIQKLEMDIETLKNNMGFLAKSKEASKLKENIEKQIAQSTEHLNTLKRQLKVLQNA